ncbi:hypothetical protein GCM10028824_18420 [Hymenobacter segetis]
MTVRTLVVLNGWLVALTGLLMVCLGGLAGLVLTAQLFVYANGFLGFKALWRRAYSLALLYFLVAGIVAALYYALGRQIGHR